MALSYGHILRFWLPLAATWVMMSVEGPVLAAVIARLGNAEADLAAYGVAYAFALVAEAPVIMLMSAATALVRERTSYLRLRNFTAALNLLVTALLLLLLLPPVFDAVTEGLIGLTPDIAGRTHGALLLLLPWPASIGFRRFYQGVLIRQGQTRRVAIATTLRLATMAATALMLYHFGGLAAGAQVGAVALSGGVVAEALATRWMARKAIRQTLGEIVPEKTPLGYGAIVSYYLPLALTPFIGLSVHPMVTFFLGKSRFALESLAVMPVVYALTFMFRAVGLSFPEVAIALIGERRENYRQLHNFALCLGTGTTLALAAIAFTPLGLYWFRDISGLSPQLAAFAMTPLRIMAVFPALTVWIGFQRALLMTGRSTTPVTVATAVETCGIFALLLLLIVYFPVAGAVAATAAYLFGRLAAIVWLEAPRRRMVPSRPRFSTPVAGAITEDA